MMTMMTMMIMMIMTMMTMSMLLITPLMLDQKSLDAMYQYESDKTAQAEKLKVKMLICKSQNMQKSLTES